MKKKVLILEDDQRLAKSLAQEFEDHDCEAMISNSISQIPSQVFDYALIDLRLAGEFGLHALPKILQSSPECRIVVLSGYGSITTAVEATKLGAVDYLTKPASFSQIMAALEGKRTQSESEFKAPSLSQVEHEYIDYLLTKNDGNISKTAKDLGLHRQSLQRKLKKYT